MKKQILFALLLTSLAGSAVLVSSCGKTEATTATTYTYAGPGSHYTITNAAGTYTINKFTATTSTTADFVVTATSTEAYGFKKLTVTAVTGTGGPTVGTSVYAFEVPGMAMFIQPVASAAPDQIVVAVASGSCPSSTTTMNWVKVKDTSGNVSNNDTFGTFAYTTTSATSGTASLPSKYKLSAPTTSLGTQSFSAATCSGGIMSVSNGGGDNAVMYLTTTGGAIVNTAATAGGEFIFGLPQASITAATFAGTYSGLLYQGGQSTGKIKPVKVVLTASGSTLSGTGTELSDPITDTVKASGGTATLSLTTMNSPSNGFMTGTLTTSGSQTLVCVGVANANSSGKQMIDCVSVDGTGLSNFMLVSR